MFVILLSLLPEDEQALILSIFDRYYGYMKKIAFSVLGNDEDAEDAVQDAMEVIASAPYKYSEPHTKAVLAKITIIARNKAIDIYRRNRRRSGLQTGLDDSFPDPYVPESAGSGLADAIGRINSRYRDLLLMRYHYGYSIREIAGMTGSTYGGVQRALSRAKKALAKELEKGDDQ